MVDIACEYGSDGNVIGVTIIDTLFFARLFPSPRGFVPLDAS